MHRLRDHRLHLWERSRRLPELHHLREEAIEGPGEHDHGAGPERSLPEHRDNNPELKGLGCGRSAARRPSLQDLPGSTLAAVLEDGVHEDLHRLAGEPGRLVHLGRFRLRPRHIILRRVSQFRAQVFDEI